jgi:5'-nucleotidase
MNRRDFVRNGFFVAGGALMAPEIILGDSNKKNSTKITILHTNDTHSNIEPFPENHPKFSGKGGVVHRQRLINRIRQEEEHVILLDAGDIFQGTPYFNMFGGVLEMKVMSEMGYDAATMGNHDFDGGMGGFLNAIKFAKFPFVCSNYDFRETELKDSTVPTLIIEKGEVKIGILGVGVELAGLVPPDKFGNTIYMDPIESANKYADELKKEGCDLIICLSHLGYSYSTDKVSDLVLASKTKNIHLIIGGHTHTFLEKPTEVKNLEGETVLINQVGWGGINLGRLDFTVHKKKFSRKDVITVQ